MIRRAYQPCAQCGGHIVASLTDNADEIPLSDLYLNLIKKLYKGDLNAGEIDIPATVENAKTYMKAVYEGYGKDFTEVKWNTPDYDKLVHLDKNVYQFSTAKNWHMMRELTSAIKEGDKILPFKDFNNKAITILEEYQVRDLKTEYNAAIAGSQMASKWVDFQKHPDALLEYRTMEDGRVRAEHQLLNNVTKPVDDPFWKTYYPPNGWNCRCTVIRLNAGKETPDKDMHYPEVPKMFQVNLGQQGLVFPKGSHYFIGLPEDIEKANLKVQRTDLAAWGRKNLSGKSFPTKIGDININNVGIDKFLSQNNPTPFEKNIALYKLPEIIQQAKYIGAAADYSNETKQYHYFKTDIAGKKGLLVVKESFNGDKNFYTISKERKIKKG